MPRFSDSLIPAAPRIFALAAVCGLTFLTSPSPSQASAPVAAAAKPSSVSIPKIEFEQYTLPNGLRVVLAPDKSKDAPQVIAVNVTYNVGSRSERPGRSGFAHLFEHMMFQGSENVAKAEHIYLVQSNGGSMNGTTNEDRTNFFETLPANQLELAVFLEADRMRSLDISKDNLENQRSVVEQEKGQSYDNRAYGHANEALQAMAYSSFPYKHTTIGSNADLDAATLEDVRDFHKTFYEPNNAVLTITGRFDKGDARKLVEKYFGPIAAGAPAPATVFNEPTIFPGERRKTMEDQLARQPQYLAGYVTVPGTDPDYYALTILGDILGQGRTSRLYQALVETRIATRVGVGPAESLGPGLFTVQMTVPAGGDIAKAETVLNGEVEKIQKDGVTSDEIETALASQRVRAVRGLETALGRASRLGLYAVLFNDPGRINDVLPNLEKVTPADVQRVARKYLVPANRSVVITMPSESAGGDAQ